jgi:hypothetical protein
MSIIRRWIVFLVTLSCAFTFTLPSPGYSDDWVNVGKNDEFSYSYNKTNININRKNEQIEVWTKFTYTEKGRERVINNRKEKGLQTTNYHNLSYSFNLYLYDYNEMKYRILSSDDYAISGDTLGSFNNSRLEFDNITPDSIFDIILIKILKDNKIKR